MKILSIFVLLTFLALLARGQSVHTWSKEDLEKYGTYEEKVEEDSISNASEFHTCLVIGHTPYYVGKIGEYFHNWTESFFQEVKIPTGGVIYYFLDSEYGNRQGMKIRYWVDSANRVSSIEISGSRFVLQHMFTQYWPKDDESAKKVWSDDKNYQVGKKFFGEIILYDYTDPQPVISIEASPTYGKKLE